MITLGFVFSIWQWLLVLVIVLIIFGAKRLPEIGKGLGKSIKEFKDEMSNDGPGSKAKVVDAKVVEEKKDNQNT